MNDTYPRGDVGPYPHVENQIVVGLPHLDLVQQELAPVGHQVLKESSLLNLALVELDDPTRAAAQLRRAEGGDPPEKESADGLDGVLAALRSRFRHRYAGWTPTLGKNRLVGQLHGAQEVIHSGGDPVALRNPPTRDPRPSGPGAGVRVGLLDTGLFAHPWLDGGWSARYSDRLPVAAPPPYAAGHATFVAGLILEQAPGATVEARKIFDDRGTAESWPVAEEIVRLGRSGIDVLNLSFACYTEDGQAPLVLATALSRIDPDVVVVAAAGNHGNESHATGGDHRRRGPQDVKPAWPAALDDVLAVGAVDRDGRRAPFSPDAVWVDLHAVGVEVRSTYLDQACDPSDGRSTRFRGGCAEWNGTSFSAALVSGAVAAACQPGRVTAREAAADLLDALRADASAPVDKTGAKFLRLPLW